MIRLRYFRGHNIHSPFVYDLVRKALLGKGGRGEIFDAVRAAGATKRSAGQIQNIFDHLQFEQLRFGAGNDRHTLYVVEDMEQIESIAHSQGTALILNPDREMQKMNFDALCVDKRGYMILFYDNKLPIKRYEL